MVEKDDGETDIEVIKVIFKRKEETMEENENGMLMTAGEG